MNDIKDIIEDVKKSSLVSNNVIKKVIEIIGQEKWNDIHDEESDICTTTGELIITLKGITYLEKENAQLKKAKETLATMNNNMWVELEKKRAESQGITNKLHQLIKATEIIKKLLHALKNEGSEYTFALENTHPVLEEAEQFLKDLEK